MDINTQSSVSVLLREASTRIDGRAAYISMLAFLLGGITKAIINISIGEISFSAWKIVLASSLMIPITLVLYFSLAVFSSKESRFGRFFNAVCLISIPIYFYIKLI